MKKTFSLLSIFLLAVTAGAQTLTECKLYSTNFQDWTAVSKYLDTETTKTVTTKNSNESLVFSWVGTRIEPDKTNGSADFITMGHAKAGKMSETGNVAPYFRTSALKNVTKITYVHSSTGSNRGWGLRMREAGQTDWTVIKSDVCQQNGSQVEVQIGNAGEGKNNVEFEWYNLNDAQNAYMNELAIYGMAVKTEATEYTISYYDQNGVKIGDKTQTEEETLTLAYTEADLTIPEGYKFRGWFTADGRKLKGGEAITNDLRLNAIVTAIETNASTSRYEYDLTKNTFYEEDHECFMPTGGSFYNAQHGWNFGASGSIQVSVSGKAYILIGNCYYSAEGTDITVKTASGDIVETFAAKAATDGAVKTIYYEGEPTTLTISFGGTTYVHSIAIYNVLNEVKKSAENWWEIPAGDVNSFLITLSQLQDGDKIFLPNGTYDIGKVVLTSISKKNISLIGESEENTIIRNAPDAETESISNTATLLVTGDNLYIQDLTLQNALDYYKRNNGRAVCLQDKATQTICKNVRMLSYQDTYYSNKIGARHYFEGGSIHGTVDYICGDGSVYFNGVELYCEKRNSTGGGSDAITASNADASDKGYVFEGCTIRSECPTVSLGRAWNNAPQCIFLNTVVDYSAGNFGFSGNDINRWTTLWMNVEPKKLGEYNTRDTEGKLLTPASNILTFYDDGKAHTSQPMETVLSAEEVANYSYENFFGTAWNPAQETTQAETEVTLDGSIYRWNGTTGDVFLLYVNDVLTGITTDTQFDASTWKEQVTDVAVRKANARGGFGRPMKVGMQLSGLENVNEDMTARPQKKIINGILVIETPTGVFNAMGQRMSK